jgi:predicted MPP superfamily phosphohydrolase
MHDTSQSAMTSVRVRWRQVALFIGALSLLVFYNEWLAYYVILLQCQWPALDVNTADFSIVDDGASSSPLRVLVLSDTHLLGSREGHWFDKLRREWQMERSFQAAMLVHDPEVVFVLGDLFDEGKWCSDSEFQYFVSRFNRMFQTSEKTQKHVVVGNHDIGFHYMTDEHKRHRFSSAFTAPSVRMVRIKDNTFVLINSMAFEGDACDMCLDAELRLRHISDTLLCAQGASRTCSGSDKFKYTKPIILQHFPMYRLSDSNCSGPDAAPANVKDAKMRPRWDCLSKEASLKLIELIQPRLILSGHTHNFCKTTFNGTPEWTIASFSWRYKNNPSFLLVTITNNNYAIAKCFLPHESTIIYTYIVGAVLTAFWFLFPRRLLTYRRVTKSS